MSPRTEDGILDLLVVGGGPGGTATAFRARELGLEVDLIDYDDLMSRIRDYSKDKLILPDFGGGHRQGFPEGDELVSALAFEPIDKDEMCACWKGHYQQHGVPARTGVELTGLEGRDDGTWEVLTFDHGARREEALAARAVVLALGRGVPRRFDIPGNTDGIAFRLQDPADFVGGPACVIGGGTSAAEAVIAMSNAKIAAEDPSAVYWSYRGDRLPRVSRALAEVFFEAYIGNGNIRYYPNSEPAAVVTGDDRRDYLALRTDRRILEGRPRETTHLEFPKEACLACIGEDLPDKLLASFGIPMVTGGARRRRRMAVRCSLESCLAGVYLVGDLLSQAYLETEDFDADPAGFREIKHRGNIKSALADGVLAAEVIAQRLAGKAEIEIPRRPTAEVPVQGAPAAAIPAAEPPGAAGPPEGALETSRRGDEAVAFLTRLLPGGVEAEESLLDAAGVTTLGRSGCDISIETDTQLSPRHASIRASEDGFTLRDDGSATGVFLRLPPGQKRQVRAGDVVRLGRQFLLVGTTGDGFELRHFDAAGRELGRFPLEGRSQVLGRQAPDLTLDPDDRTLSRRQLAVSVEAGEVLVKDLKSVNGSYLRVRDALPLVHGDRFRVGQQTFLFQLRDDPGMSLGPSSPSAPVPGPSAGSTGEPIATFPALGKRLTVLPDQTLCEAAEAAGLPITAECHAGICGSDPVRILSGQEHLEGGPDDQERETLEEICGREPGEHRLACMVRVRGPVEVEIL